MTISTVINRVTYPGDGSTTDWPVPFPILAADELRVTIRTDATGVDVLQALTTNYTVSGVAVRTGANLAMLAPHQIGETLIIERSMAIGEQPVDLRNLGSFLPETYEAALDRLAMQIGQLANLIGITGIDELNLYTTATRPTASADMHRKLVMINDGGTDKVQICMYNGATYEWVTLYEL